MLPAATGRKLKNIEKCRTRRMNLSWRQRPRVRYSRCRRRGRGYNTNLPRAALPPGLARKYIGTSILPAQTFSLIPRCSSQLCPHLCRVYMKLTVACWHLQPRRGGLFLGSARIRTFSFCFSAARCDNGFPAQSVVVARHASWRCSCECRAAEKQKDSASGFRGYKQAIPPGFDNSRSVAGIWSRRRPEAGS